MQILNRKNNLLKVVVYDNVCLNSCKEFIVSLIQNMGKARV